MSSSGPVCGEFLDHVLFWTSPDLDRKLCEFKDYYNGHRCRAQKRYRYDCIDNKAMPRTLLTNTTTETSTVQPLAGGSKENQFRQLLEILGVVGPRETRPKAPSTAKGYQITSIALMSDGNTNRRITRLDDYRSEKCCRSLYQLPAAV